MPRRPEPSDPEVFRQELVELLQDFAKKLQQQDLRKKVVGLIPAFHKLRDLGCSLVPTEEQPDNMSARNRILAYMRKYVGHVIDGDELMVVSGISDWPRRVRELRVEHGWAIISGVTATEAQEDSFSGNKESRMRPDQYMLLVDHQDERAAFRWNLANDIRKQHGSSLEKLLKYFKANIGKPLTSEELRYVAGGKSEWARRIRELRTEQGWPVKTRFTGRPDLPSGMYIMESERQDRPHDRHISDFVRGKVLERDNYACRADTLGLPQCGWNYERGERNGDQRFLELHHR